MKTGVSVLTDNPREVGADRVVNTLAAFTRFGGPCVVVDFGTSTNFDVVSDKGEFLGGVIAPGLQISAGERSWAEPRASPVSISAAAIAGRAIDRRGDPVRPHLRHRRRGRWDRRPDPRRARRARRDRHRDRRSRPGRDPALPHRGPLRAVADARGPASGLREERPMSERARPAARPRSWRRGARAWNASATRPSLRDDARRRRSASTEPDAHRRDPRAASRISRRTRRPSRS